MAANTGVINGSDMLLFIDVAGTLTPIAHLTSQSFDSSMATKDRSSKDTGSFVVKKPGKISGNISFDGLTTYDGYNFWNLWALYKARTTITVKYGGHSDNTREGLEEQVGDKYFEVTGFISSLKRTDPNDEDSTLTGTIDFLSEPTVETVAV